MSELVDRALRLLEQCHNNHPNRIMVPGINNIKGAAQYGLNHERRKHSMTRGDTDGSPYAYRLHDRPNHSIEVFMEEGTGPGDDRLKKTLV